MHKLKQWDTPEICQNLLDRLCWSISANLQYWLQTLLKATLLCQVSHRTASQCCWPAHCTLLYITNTVIAIEYASCASPSAFLSLTYCNFESRTWAAIQGSTVAFDPLSLCNKPGCSGNKFGSPSCHYMHKTFKQKPPSAATTRNTSHLVVENIWSHSAKPSDCRWKFLRESNHLVEIERWWKNLLPLPLNQWDHEQCIISLRST